MAVLALFYYCFCVYQLNLVCIYHQREATKNIYLENFVREPRTPSNSKTELFWFHMKFGIDLVFVVICFSKSVAGEKISIDLG